MLEMMKPAVFKLMQNWSAFGGILLMLALAGCASNKINWAERVGIYTHDQAIMDFGPPDRSAKLTDGTLVEEWLTQRGYTHGYVGSSYAYGPYGYGAGPGTYTASRSPDYYIRLTFGTDGILTEWKRVER